MRISPLWIFLFGIALTTSGAIAEVCGPAISSPAIVPFAWRGHEVKFEPVINKIRDQLNSGANFDVLVIGDSIMQRWPLTMLKQAAGTDRVLNAGVGGDGAPATLWRLSEREMAVRVDARPAQIGIKGWNRIDPSRILLLLGTNDLARKATACSVVQGIEAVVEMLRSYYPKAAIRLSRCT